MSRGLFLKLPVEYMNGREVRRLLRSHGHAAFGVLMCFLPELTKWPGYRLPRSLIGDMADALRMSEAELSAFLEAALGAEVLSEDEAGIYSADLIEWRSEYDKKSESARNRQPKTEEASAELPSKSDQSLPKDSGERAQSASISLSPSLSDSSSPSEGEPEREGPIPQEVPPGKTLHGEYACLDQIEIGNFRAHHGDEVLREAIRLVDARVKLLEHSKGERKKYLRLREEAQSAGASLTKWALREAFNNITRTKAQKANLEAAKARQARASARSDPPPDPNKRAALTGVAGDLVGRVKGVSA